MKLGFNEKSKLFLSISAFMICACAFAASNNDPTSLYQHVMKAAQKNDWSLVFDSMTPDFQKKAFGRLHMVAGFAVGNENDEGFKSILKRYGIDADNMPPPDQQKLIMEEFNKHRREFFIDACSYMKSHSMFIPKTRKFVVVNKSKDFVEGFEGDENNPITFRKFGSEWFIEEWKEFPW